MSEHVEQAEHLDILVIGAGLSGIGAAVHVSQDLPGRTYAVLEGRERIGGTWDLFRYPGVRSDSDMFTLGYRFKPWRGDQVLADGPSIREYVAEAAVDYGVDQHIRFGHRVVRAEWSSTDARWTVTAEHAGETVELTASVLWAATGYYRYDEGYQPDLPGLDEFRGTVVHPQHWPEDLDYSGRRIVVVGSGATAVTLVPALAEDAAHVTMLQRSPTYVVTLPSHDPLAGKLRRVLGERRAYAAKRWINARQAQLLYRLSRRRPDLVRRLVRFAARKQLPEGYPVDVHFRPAYDPWDQRMCFVPDGDLFRALSQGTASVVTDTIETFTPDGIRLTSGERLEADLVVTATGLNVEVFHGLEIVVDGELVDPAGRLVYKGLLLDGVPNFVFVFGYTNASWTLKADLVSEYTVRLLRHLDERGARVFVAPRDDSVTAVPFSDFRAGYVLRAIDRLPKQGDRAPWTLAMSYVADVKLLREGAIDDGTLTFR